MKRDLIVTAGTDALATNCLAELDLSAIANSAGLKPSSLRYYFSNREELAEEIYLRRLNGLEASFIRAEAAGSIQEVVETLVGAELQSIARYRAGQSSRPVQLGEVRSLDNERRRRVGKAFHRCLNRLGEILVRQGGANYTTFPEAAAHLVIENLFWMPAWINQYRTWEFAHVGKNMTQVLCSGIVSGTQRVSWSVLKENIAERSDETVTQSDFLRAATRLISQKGYRGVSIDLIASELGVTKGSFYHHNTIKKALVEQCFSESYERIGEFQRRATEACAQPTDRIATSLASIIHVQLQQSSPIIRATALPSLPAGVRMGVIDEAGPIIRWISGELSMAQAQGVTPDIDPYIAAQSLSAGSNAAFDLGRLYNAAGAELTVDTVLDLLLRGIAK